MATSFRNSSHWGAFLAEVEGGRVTGVRLGFTWVADGDLDRAGRRVDDVGDRQPGVEVAGVDLGAFDDPHPPFDAAPTRSGTAIRR